MFDSSSSTESEDFGDQNTIKVVLLGSTGVGKTAIVDRFVKNVFNQNTKVTVGSAFNTKPIKIGKQEFHLNIWDTAGQEKFHSLAKMYYRDAVAAIICFDITKQESFLECSRWRSELQESGSPDILLTIVGNKTDLEGSRTVKLEAAEKWAQNNDCVYLETSAKSGYNIQEIFDQICVRYANNNQSWENSEKKIKRGFELNEKNNLSPNTNQLRSTNEKDGCC
ncbi:ras-related protein rab-5c [Anaeramoeba flamelloides]|uniref:Ras-related protein rab-5c n=1 Tax=Anaeramoeba flamelloides TaxID=1746091 RepID=A0AAV8A6F2_9EUKA|nr:ras-related protein rab-5c [Anaeramoeba flamelloides]KAJ6236048.1 ras-related protein rab-5c [Anaeramoeba flamelloides]